MRFLLGGRVRLIALLAVAFAAVAALPAAAKVPGSNGRIVFARVVNPDTDDSITYTANPDGRIINPDTGSFRTLAMQDPNVGTFCQIWSPDAKRLACDGESDSDPSRNGIY